MPEKKTRICVDCGKPIGRKATRCGTCAARVNYRERTGSLLRAWQGTPEARAMRSKANKERLKDQTLRDRISNGLKKFFASHPERIKRGAQIYNWKGGHRKESQAQRNSIPAREWRAAVLKRDNYTCRKCGKTGGYLHTHHVKEWHNSVGLRFDVSNGLTLCPDCHSKIHGRKIGKAKYDNPLKKCPKCGGEKGLHSALCQSCRYAKERSKAQKRCVCPRCGKMKMPKARVCIECHLQSKRLPKKLCPDCGAPLSEQRTQRCRRCANIKINRDRFGH